MVEEVMAVASSQLAGDGQCAVSQRAELFDSVDSQSCSCRPTTMRISRAPGGDRRGAAATPELGSPQAARMARRPPLGARAARSEYGGRSLAPPGTRAAAPPPPSLEASGRARARYRGTERRVDRGLQGPLPHRRWRVLLSPDGRRPAQPLSARL